MSKHDGKLVEQKLYEAFRARRGVRLTAQDVEDLLVLDDAMQTRILNAACMEAGREEAGATFGAPTKTWRELGETGLLPEGVGT